MVLPRCRWWVSAGLLVMGLCGVCRATEERLSAIDLRNLAPLSPLGFLADGTDNRIYGGRKQFWLDPAADPVIANNNARLLLRRVTGLHLVEQEAQGVHWNVGFRGITPDNAVGTQVWQDGFPLNASPFGLRLVPAVPDFQQVQQIRFFPSAAGVLSGASPGGAIHFLSYPAASDQPWRLRHTTTVGPFGYAASLFDASGTVDEFSYAVFGRYARGDGTHGQPDFEDGRGGARASWRVGEADTFTLGYQFYQFDSEQVSGVAVNTAGVNNLLNYYFQDATQHFIHLRQEHEISADSRLDSRLWYHDTEGFRDFTVTVAPVLGRTTDRIHYAGAEVRWGHRYDTAAMVGNMFTLGALAQGAVGTLTSVPVRAGEARLGLDHDELNLAVFGEHKFQLTERWSVTPGLRLEYTRLGGDGFRSDAVVNRRFEDAVPLFSLGTEVDLVMPRAVTARPLVFYAAVANTYRPPTFNESVDQDSAVRLAPGLDSAHAYQVEAGLRGQPVTWYQYDLSAFWMTYDNQFATVGGVVRNAGRTRHAGVEWFQEIEFFGAADARAGRPAGPVRVGPRAPETETGWARYGRFSAFSALSWLATEIERSPFAGARGAAVPYAPEWTLKLGLAYDYFERFKVALSWRHVSGHLGNVANDNLLLNNNRAARIPAYSVLDFSAEYSFWRDRATLFVNANNVLDERYVTGLQGGAGVGSEIRAPRFNTYAGLRLTY